MRLEGRKKGPVRQVREKGTHGIYLWPRGKIDRIWGDLKLLSGTL
jgi:hypothetical protein